jgi:hypothetical protein
MPRQAIVATTIPVDELKGKAGTWNGVTDVVG